MTLRLALLLVSLIILGIIGFVCHLKYQRNSSKKRPGETLSEFDADSQLDQEVNTPFFTENVISDIPEEAVSVLQSKQGESTLEAEPPALTTSLQELMDNKKVAQQLAQQMLPVHEEGDFIMEYVAVLPNINDSVKKINKAVSHLQRDLQWPAEILVTKKDPQKFTAISSLKDKTKIRHLKTTLQLKGKKGVADEQLLEDYQQFVNKLANQFGCEYRFALEPEQANAAVTRLDEFIKDNDQIIILYILAQPDDSFSGEALNNTVTEAGLEHGEFDFFHLTSSSETNQGAKLYSIANMYKPGSFDLKTLDKFSTTGLCVFMVPALLKDPVSGFREMCTSCKYIADQLNGVLTTNQRELLGEENYIVICTDITAQKDKMSAAGVESGSELAKKLFA